MIKCPDIFDPVYPPGQAQLLQLGADTSRHGRSSGEGSGGGGAGSGGPGAVLPPDTACKDCDDTGNFFILLLGPFVSPSRILVSRCSKLPRENIYNNKVLKVLSTRRKSAWHH